MTKEARPRLVAALLTAVFFCVIGLAVAPQLHERIHSDANRIEHSCAVTFVASGSYEHAVGPDVVAAPIARIGVVLIASALSQWVPSPFLAASIFEHAPPQNS
jgi:hypothetical protein